MLDLIAIALPIPPCRARACLTDLAFLALETPEAGVKLYIVTILDLAARSGAVRRVAGIATALTDRGGDVEVISAPPSRIDAHRNQLLRWALVLRAAWAVRRAVEGKLAHESPATRLHPDLPARRVATDEASPRSRDPLSAGDPWSRVGGLSGRREEHPRRDLRPPRRSRAWGAVGIIAVTEELRRAAIDRVGVPIPSIVIGNAADIELAPARSRSEVRARVGTPLESPVMVMAGVEAPWHGTDLALRILERLPSHDAELWLIGIMQPSVRD